MLAFALAPPARAADPPSDATSTPAAAEASGDRIDSEKLFAAIVKVQTVAVPNARSIATLGRERQGSGVVIGENGRSAT